MNSQIESLEATLSALNVELSAHMATDANCQTWACKGFRAITDLADEVEQDIVTLSRVA